MNENQKSYLYHLNMIDNQINEAILELDKFSPYPENKEYHVSLMKMSNLTEKLIRIFKTEFE